MLFVDGENLAIRYQSLLKDRELPNHVRLEPGVFVWTHRFNNACMNGGVRRKHYYTSVQGDIDRLEGAVMALKDLGVEAPRVFKRVKSRGSKRVDISLTTEMLIHATRKNYETAVLVAGDEDYVPLVEAVQAEGRRVYVWFLSNGLSPALQRAADYFVCLDTHLLDPRDSHPWK
jgi:hypothetical protein